MSEQAILTFDQVSKRFTFATEQPGTVLETVIDKLVPRRRQRTNPNQGELWALRGISFAVKPGESWALLAEMGVARAHS